jgi:hypothetical protein
MAWVDGGCVNNVTRRYLSDVSMDELRTVIAAKNGAAALAKLHQITWRST